MTYTRIPYVELHCDHPAVLSDGDTVTIGGIAHSTRCSEIIRVSIPPPDDSDRPVSYAREVAAKYHGWSTEAIEGTKGWHPENRHDLCREHTMLQLEGIPR